MTDFRSGYRVTFQDADGSNMWVQCDGKSFTISGDNVTTPIWVGILNKDALIEAINRACEGAKEFGIAATAQPEAVSAKLGITPTDERVKWLGEHIDVVEARIMDRIDQIDEMLKDRHERIVRLEEIEEAVADA